VRRAWLLVALLGAAAPARAHEILHTVERGKAVALRAYFADGEALAYAEYQIFAPFDAKIPYQKGRTDRAGYLAFVPDPPGRWRVLVADASGHGLDVVVDAGASPSPARPEPRIASWAFVLRPLLGALVVVAIFLALVLIYRRRKKA
jgi:nickel transport protein